MRTLDNTESIAAALARYVRFRRAYGTLNELFRAYESVTPEDIQAVARKYFTDAGLVVTTLSKDPMPEAMATQPALASLAAPSGGAAAAEPAATSAPPPPPASLAAPSAGAAAAGSVRTLDQPTALPQLNVKLLFTVGSAHDPAGKEGLAALSAAMIAEAGSRAMRIDEIKKALFPMAGSFDAQVDKEMTTFTGSIHRDNWGRFLDIALPMLLEPGLREEDFRRVKDAQMNALKQDLRNNNEEELGKERLQVNDLRGHALRPSRAGDGGRHRGHHPRRRAGVPQGPLHAGPTSRWAWRATPPREMRAGCRAPWPRCPKGRPRRAGGRRGPRTEGDRGRDRGEGHARDRDLLRPSRSRSRAAIPTSRPCGWRGPGWASTGRRSRTSTSASARSAG